MPEPSAAPPPRARERLSARLTKGERRFAAIGVVASLAIAAIGGVPVFAQASPGATGWLLKCSYVKSAPDDPILNPGMSGMSHLHDFYGNTSTSAASTYTAMNATTCPSGDTAGYWTPALYRNGVKIDLLGHGVREQIYYRANNVASGTRITPFPPDFRMVAGVATADSAAANPQLSHEIYFGCSDNSESGKPAAPVNCTTGIISVHIGPNCWDGVLTHSNDTSHVIYPSGNTCPAGHAITLPRLIERFEYPVGTDSSGITLASGPTFTFHADFWNTWQQDKLASLVTHCFAGQTNCGTDPSDGSAPPVTATPSGPAGTPRSTQPSSTPGHHHSSTPASMNTTQPTNHPTPPNSTSGPRQPTGSTQLTTPTPTSSSTATLPCGAPTSSDDD